MEKIKLKWKSLTAGILTVIILLNLWGWVFGSGDSASAQYEQTAAELGTVRNSISVAGTAELVDEQKLRFNQDGKVTAVYFSDGDTVKADDVIAELDKEDLENEIRQAEISLENSQITLQNLLDGSTEAEITKARNSVSQLEKNLEVAKQNLEVEKVNYEATLQELDDELELAQEDYEEKQRNLETAQTNLANTLIYEEDDMNATTAEYYQKFLDALSTAKGYIDDVQSDLDTVNQLVGIEGEYEGLNDAYEANLGVLDSSTLSDTKSQYKNLKAVYSGVYEQYKATTSGDIDETLALLSSVADLLDQDTDMLDAYYDMLNATTSGTNISQSEVESYKSSASNLKSSAQSKVTSIQNLINDLNNTEGVDVAQLRSNETIASKQDAVESAELSLKKSKNTLDNLQQTIASKKESARLSLVSAENDLENTQNNLIEARDDLEDLLDGEDEDTIAKARNDVIQKELSLEKTKSQADQYEIIAPFNGVVRQIDYQVGDNILSDDDAYVYIENPDLLKIEILLDQIDIIDVEIGQTAEIVFDAYPDLVFEGLIEEVNQTPESSSGVVSYPVSLTLNKGDEKIYSGMTATVDIIIDEAEDVIVLDNDLINTNNSKSTVLKLVDGQPVLTEVVLGVSDDITTEIISGVQEGDVILSEARAVSTTQSSSSTQRSGMMGGGFGGMSGPPM